MSEQSGWQSILRYFTQGLASNLNFPESAAPAPSEFAAFINGRFCPVKNLLRAQERLNHLLALTGKVKLETDEWRRDLLGMLNPDDILNGIADDEYLRIRQITMDGLLECESDNEGEIRLHAVDLEEARTARPQELRPPSFMVPLIEAWVRHPELRPVEPEHRRHRIMPEPVRYAVASQALLAVSAGSVLPELGQQPATTAYLPGLEPSPGVVVPVLPLSVAEAGDAGPGAPIAPRLWFGCQMAVPLQKRSGEKITVPFTLREVSDWLWPHGWNRSRNLPQLREGLRSLALLGVVWQRTEWLLVRPINLPTAETRLDDYLYADVLSLPGSGRGPMIDTQRLWELGTMGSVPWRIWIRLAYLWDDVKKHNGGHRVYASRPEVKRGQNKGILDARGQPVLKSNGQPVLDWSHGRAVRTGRQERHPQAGRVPLLGTGDLALLGFDNARVPDSTLRRRASKTREWLRKLESMGAVALETVGHEIRVLEPFPERTQELLARE